MTLKFTVAFMGVDLDDFELLDRLAQELPTVHWGEVDGDVRADVFSHAHSFVEAVQDVNKAVGALVPDARATHLVEDFVAVPDIAKRTHVNRETVRLWSKEVMFPQPRGVVGNGIKIWDWGTVNTWLQDEHAGALGDPYRHPSPAETAQINTLLQQIEFHVVALATSLKARPRIPSRQWEDIPAVGFTDITSLRIGVGSESLAPSRQPVAG